jgi:hypothetical protein
MFVKKYPENFTKNIDHPDTCMHVTRNTKYNEKDLFVAPCRNTKSSKSSESVGAYLEPIDVKLFTKKIEAIVIG